MRFGAQRNYQKTCRLQRQKGKRGCGRGGINCRAERAAHPLPTQGSTSEPRCALTAPGCGSGSWCHGGDSQEGAGPAPGPVTEVPGDGEGDEAALSDEQTEGSRGLVVLVTDTPRSDPSRPEGGIPVPAGSEG